MKKFYLPPQLGGIAPQNYIKTAGTENSEFTKKTTDKVKELYTNNLLAQNEVTEGVQPIETQDLSIEQALKEYYEYINNQNK